MALFVVDECATSYYRDSLDRGKPSFFQELDLHPGFTQFRPKFPVLRRLLSARLRVHEFGVVSSLFLDPAPHRLGGPGRRTSQPPRQYGPSQATSRTTCPSTSPMNLLCCHEAIPPRFPKCRTFPPPSGKHRAPQCAVFAPRFPTITVACATIITIMRSP